MSKPRTARERAVWAAAFAAEYQGFHAERLRGRAGGYEYDHASIGDRCADMADDAVLALRRSKR